MHRENRWTNAASEVSYDPGTGAFTRPARRKRYFDSEANGLGLGKKCNDKDI